MRDIQRENLLDCHGRRFRAKIKGVACEGVITVQDGEVYLCQNVKDGGFDHIQTHGYEYAWMVTYNGEIRFDFHTINVTDFELLEDPKGSVQDDIQAAITLLKENGYKVLKQNWIEV